MTKQEFLAMSIFTGLKYIEDNKKIVDLHCIYNGSSLVNFGWGDAKNIDEVFPILHPRSDLTKPIEHKGEKFVPSVKLNETITGHTWNYFAINTENVLLMNFEIVLNLIEWHFDLADLISKGEAIDINTLEANPYK